MFDPTVFSANRAKFTLEDLLPYEQQYVAWSTDGSRILAASQSIKTLYATLDRLGKPECVHDYIDFDSHMGGIRYDPRQEEEFEQMTRQAE